MRVSDWFQCTFFDYVFFLNQYFQKLQKKMERTTERVSDLIGSVSDAQRQRKKSSTSEKVLNIDNQNQP